MWKLLRETIFGPRRRVELAVCWGSEIVFLKLKLDERLSIIQNKTQGCKIKISIFVKTIQCTDRTFTLSFG